jgi:hypothetical protein
LRYDERMIMIYINKEWLPLVGAASTTIEMFPLNDENPSAGLVASKVEIEHPFLRAELLRKEKTRAGNWYLTSYIPLHVVHGIFGACQRLLDRSSRNLVSFLFSMPIPGFSHKISHQEAVGATIGGSLDPQHPGFFGPVRIGSCTS